MKDPIEMWIAVEAQPIADDLIPKYHVHLLDAKILLVFTNQPRKKCDRVRLASASRLGALQKFLSSGMRSVLEGHDFLMLIAADEWSHLSEAQRIALVDHELSHMGYQEKEKADGAIEGRFVLRGHDIEEFRAVVERHGLWRTDAEEMAQVMRQFPLPFERESSINSVTMSTEERSVTVTDRQFKNAVRSIVEG